GRVFLPNLEPACGAPPRNTFMPKAPSATKRPGKPKGRKKSDELPLSDAIAPAAAEPSEKQDDSARTAEASSPVTVPAETSAEPVSRIEPVPPSHSEAETNGNGREMEAQQMAPESPGETIQEDSARPSPPPREERFDRQERAERTERPESGERQNRGRD